MYRVAVSVLLTASLLLLLAPAAAPAQDAPAAPATDFKTFFEETHDQIMKLHEAGTDQSSSIVQILDQIRERAQKESDTVERSGVLRWVSSEYRTAGKPDVAVAIAEQLVTDKGTPPENVHALQVDLAYWYGEATKFDKSADMMKSLLNDPATTPEEKTQIVATGLTNLADIKSWANAQKVAEVALEQHLGNETTLRGVIGRSAMESGDYAKAKTTYEAMLNQFGASAHPLETLEWSKDLLTCEKTGRTDTVEYLTDLTALLDRFKSDPAAGPQLGGQILTEYTAVAEGWLGLVDAYKGHGEESPVTAEWARNKALQVAQPVFDALEALSPEEQRRMPNYRDPLMKLGFTTADTLASLGRLSEAQAILARLKAKVGTDDPRIAKTFEDQALHLTQIDASLHPSTVATASASPAPAVAAPVASVKPTPMRTAMANAKATPAAAAAEGTGGHMGGGTIALIGVLVAGAVLLLVLAMRKPKAS